MRLNRYVAQATGMSRRKADEAISTGKVLINGNPAALGSEVYENDLVVLSGQKISLPSDSTVIILNKPFGYVSSRNGQGSKTVYDLLPEKYHRLKPIGRLDKDSSGLLLLTDDGKLANELTHPRYQKEKIYRVKLNKNLSITDKKYLLTGVKLADGPSKFIKLSKCSENEYEVILAEGRNRQIRRSFNALGYKVVKLKRIKFGNWFLPPQLEPGAWMPEPSGKPAGAGTINVSRGSSPT